jgi:RNA polymerase sigma-B factor
VQQTTTTARSHGHDDTAREDTDRLVAELRCCRDDRERDRVRHLLTVTAMPVATSIAMRYRRRGAPLDDLIQAAHLGLVKAVKGFDPDRGTEFITYAVPTITGEVRRLFRDQGWDIRPPRRIQELRPRVREAAADLAQVLGRSPRVAEIAARLAVDEDDVVEAIASADSYNLTSLDAPVGDADQTTLAETVGNTDPALAKVEDLITLRGLILQLSERDRRLLELRFFHERTQQQIATEIGVTQMQVSRLLSRLLARLHAGMTGA